MAKKTLEQYIEEFEKIGLLEKQDIYENLAKECIADFPDNELGYIELGKAFTDDDFGRDSSKIKAISALAKKESKYIKTLESILENNCLLQDDIYYVYRVEKQEFAKVYFLCGRAYVGLGCYTDAAYQFYISWQLGINYKEFIIMLNPPLSSITIENNLCIKNLVIEDIGNYNEIFFLGENGVGKTILLQSIISLINTSDIGKKYANEIVGLPDIQSYQNLFAYGTARFRTGSETDDFLDKTGYDTLYDRNKVLKDPIQWFKDIDHKALKNLTQIKIEKVLQTFEEIIDFDNSKSFKIKQEGINFVFYENETKTEFNNLADGYRSVLIWLCDLLSRLSENQPYIEKLEDFYGVVLIDEIDLFLHPKWQYNIVKKLREKLPNIQWFFTTHSPILILGASEDAVFYRLYKENGETKISEQWKCSDINNLLANSILTSPLFDLESARMRAFDETKKELDTNTNYWNSRIEKIIKEERTKRKKEGKQYFTEQEIDEIVKSAISQLKTEVSNDKN